MSKSHAHPMMEELQWETSLLVLLCFEVLWIAFSQHRATVSILLLQSSVVTSARPL